MIKISPNHFWLLAGILLLVTLLQTAIYYYYKQFSLHYYTKLFHVLFTFFLLYWVLRAYYFSTAILEKKYVDAGISFLRLVYLTGFVIYIEEFHINNLTLDLPHPVSFFVHQKYFLLCLLFLCGFLGTFLKNKISWILCMGVTLSFFGYWIRLFFLWKFPYSEVYFIHTSSVYFVLFFAGTFLCCTHFMRRYWKIKDKKTLIICTLLACGIGITSNLLQTGQF